MKTSDTSGMPHELVLAENIPYVISNNVDKNDGLINGAVGVLKEVTLVDEKPFLAWLKFGDVNTGRQLRAKLQKRFPEEIAAGWTPISRVVKSFCLRLHGRNKSMVAVDRSQFPMCPAAALTIHKLQGKTVDAIELDLRSGRPCPALHYVALSRARTEAGNRLAFDLDPTQIKVCQKVVAEMERMRQSCLMRQQLRLPCHTVKSEFMAVFHNVESLHKYIAFARAFVTYRGADLLIFCETWLKSTDSDSTYAIPGYNLHRFDWPYPKGGRPHAGMAVYVKTDMHATVSVEQIGASGHAVQIESPTLLVIFMLFETLFWRGFLFIFLC